MTQKWIENSTLITLSRIFKVSLINGTPSGKSLGASALSKEEHMHEKEAPPPGSFRRKSQGSQSSSDDSAFDDK